MRKSLSLRKETLVDLTPDDLAAVVVAGTGFICVSNHSCSVCNLPPITPDVPNVTAG